MSDSFGPSEDCIVCGQPQSAGNMVRCYGCEADMCKHCRINHDCQKLINERTEEFIKKLDPHLCAALKEFGYSFVGESTTDEQVIFEFTSSMAPRMEVRIDK